MGSWVVAGALAWLGELVLCVVRGHAWYLRYHELALFALGALWLPASLVALGAAERGWEDRSPRARRVPGLFVSAALLVAGAWIGTELTAGRRLQGTPARPLLIALSTLAFGLAWPLGHRFTQRARTASDSWRRAVAGGAGLVAVALGAADQWLLPRLYPAFHVALTLGALGAWVVLARVLPEPPRLAARGRWVTIRALPTLALAGAVGLVSLQLSLNAGFATRQAAPWTGKVLEWTGKVSGLLPELDAPPAQPTAQAAAPRELGRGVDLREHDVLLVTVDALRADALGAYGGEVGTPALDALAREGAVFERAYTPTPHTSYALSSMLTGKPLRQVLALESARADHVTLPDLLRRYGYRTAAFYPPAIFFVDSARFAPLAARGFGFEYQKKMFAEAEERVDQVSAYLAQVTAGKPVFVWVHLFEPHEPYDPPEGEPRGTSPRARYDAEVRYVDGAVGRLVKAFRAARPGATVIVSADHGEEFGDHGGQYHGTTLFDEQVRVPLLWSAPGVVPSARIAAPVELYDVATSLLAALGIPPDARMRGDDLGEALSGAGPGPRYAFGSVEDRAMVVDARHKAVCGPSGSDCRLYDLEGDPHERRNLAGEKPEVLSRLREALSAHLGGIAREEVVPLADGVGYPEALVRARLGAPGVGPDLVPLLGSPRAETRAEAARALGELRFEGARQALGRLGESDPAPEVRREAALASCALGEARGCGAARAQLKSDDLALSRRAARALGRAGRPEAAGVLTAWAADPEAEESERVAAIELLAKLGAREAEGTLIELLSEVRLRPVVARALGTLGTSRAADALAAYLAEERYPPARRAEARALLQLGDRRARPLIERMLGTESSVPQGVHMLVEAGALDERPSARGAVLVAGSAALVGTWGCEAHGCLPADDATLQLPGPRRRDEGPVRLVVATHAESAAELRIDGRPLSIAPGADQHNLLFSSRPGRLRVEAKGEVRVCAVTVVPQTPEIEPPPPEPWGEEAAQDE